MKKLLLCILLCACAVVVSAQDHAEFKGIQIDGDLNSFVSKLQEQGYSIVVEDDTFIVVEGDFGGEQCQIMIEGTKITKTVYRVCVIANKSNTWSRLKADYNEYKGLLTSKYGSGYSVEYFSDPYYEGDGYEVSAIRNGKCTYVTNFEIPNGEIRLGLSYFDKGCIVIGYVDSANKVLANNEAANKKSMDL